jgi:hypothetical protein
MKNLVLLALRTIGVDRKHPEFRACWSHLYKGVQFAMASRLGCDVKAMR